VSVATPPASSLVTVLAVVLSDIAVPPPWSLPVA